MSMKMSGGSFELRMRTDCGSTTLKRSDDLEEIRAYIEAKSPEGGDADGGSA